MARRWIAALCVAVVLTAVPSAAHAYNLLPYKMGSQIWYNASDYFLDQSREDMRRAMSEWNAYIPEYRRLCYNPATHNQSWYPGHGDGYNRIYKHSLDDYKNLAINYYIHDNSTKILTESDIVINSDHRWVNGVQAGAYDVKSVIKHELGHTTGLGHSSFWIALMWPTMNDGEIKTELKSDDIGGLQARYQ